MIAAESISLALPVYTFQAPGDESAPWWLFWLLLILGLASVAGWWLTRREPAAQAETVEAASPAAPPEVEPVVAEERAAEPVPVAAETPPPSPDDLTRIEGIGPKISGLLESAGITTYRQLAATDVGHVEQILREAQLRAPTEPATWPEQARLAATGDWAVLEKLQDQLKGGRRAT